MTVDFSLPSKKVSMNAKVAFIKLDAIGDFLLWLHSANALSQRYGSHNITLIADECNKNIAQQLDLWNDTFYFSKIRFITSTRYRRDVILDLQKLQIGTAIHCSYSRSFEVGDSVVRALRASSRIGYVGDCSNMSPIKKWISDRWYTRLIQTSDGAIHEIDKHEQFLKALGLTNYTKGVYRLPKIGTEISSNVCRSVFIVFPGASWEGRKWGKHNFSELIKKLLPVVDGDCLLCGGSEDVDTCNWIITENEFNPRIVNLAGKTSFVEFLELVRRSIFLVGNESSCIHAAAVVRTPVVCILGGGHFGRFAPYNRTDPDIYVDSAFTPMDCFGCNWKCIKNYSATEAVPCIAAIAVNDIFLRCLNAMNERLEHADSA